jgi:hypothetical protein
MLLTKFLYFSFLKERYINLFYNLYGLNIQKNYVFNISFDHQYNNYNIILQSTPNKLIKNIEDISNQLLASILNNQIRKKTLKDVVCYDEKNNIININNIFSKYTWITSIPILSKYIDTNIRDILDAFQYNNITKIIIKNPIKTLKNTDKEFCDVNIKNVTIKDILF